VTKRRGRHGWLAVVLGALVVLPAPSQIRVQVQGAGLDGGKPEPPPGYPSDQTVVRSLDEAKKRRGEKAVAAASAALQQVLNRSEDTWIQEGDKGWRSAHVIAERTLVDDPVWLADYRSQFEHEAAAELKEAGADRQRLARVMRRFFLTRAGAEAAERLATTLLDAGQANLAVVYLQRVLDSPAHQGLDTTRLRFKLAAARKLADVPASPRAAPSTPAFDADSQLLFGGKPALAADLLGRIEPRTRIQIETLADWPLPTGNASRTAQTSGGLPLLGAERTALAQPLSDNKKLLAQFDRLAERNRQRNRATYAGLQPIIVGRTVFARTCRGVEAIDLESGKPRWPGPYTVGDPIDKQELMFDEWEDAGRTMSSSALESFILGNTLYGTLTSDGRRVFLIDELYVQPGSYNLFVLGRDKSDATRKSCNRLTALDAATGKVLWKLGGSEARQAGDPHGQLYFFGPPTPVGDRLYALAELQSEVGLWELDAATGKPTWKQRLMLMHRRVDADPFRRSQTCSVVASEGIALCATNTARLFAVDLVARSVLWERDFDGDLAQRAYLNFNFIDVVPPPENPNLADPPVVGAGRVVFQGPNLQGIHCLDLRTGQTRWRKERAGDQHVAGVQQEKVILVGSGRVRALDVENGEEVWRTSTPAPGGRGVFADGKYLLPTERGDCLAIDVATGKPAGTSFSVEGPNRPLGNLASRGDALVSLGRGGLRVFPLVELIRNEAADRLAKDAKDPRGLYQSGLIALHEQQLDAAAGKLLASLRSGAEFPERAQASQTLLRLASEETLGAFAEMDLLLGELRKVAKEPRDQAVVLRLEARSHLNAGRWADALVAAEKQAEARDGGLVQSFADSSAREPWLWAKSFARRVFAKAPAERRDDLLRDVERRFASKMEAGDLEGMQHVAAMYDRFPIGRKTRLTVGRRLLARRRLDLASIVYSAACRSAVTDDEKAAALSGLSAVADAGRLPFDAFWYLERWKREAPEGRDADARTVAQAVADFLKANGSKPPTAPEPKRWISSSIRTEIVQHGDRRGYAGRQWIRPVGGDAPYFQRHAFSFKRGESTFAAVNMQTARTDHQTTLGEETLRSAGGQVRDTASVAGYVYFAAVDDKIAAVSVLDGGSLVWCAAPGVPDSLKEEFDPVIEWSQFGERRSTEAAIQVGPAGPDFLVVRSAKELLAVDPQTGKLLWRRSDLASGRRIFGDAEFLYVVGDKGDFVCIRPDDGEKIGEGRWAWFDADYTEDHCRGRLILRTAAVADGLEIRLWDPATDETVWTRRFPKRTRRWASSASAPIAVMTPDDKIELLDEATGTTAAGFALERPIGPKAAIRTFRRGETIFACVEDGERRFVVRGPTGGVDSDPVHGRLYAFAPGGTKPLWERPVKDTRVLGWPLEGLPVVMLLETPEARRGNAEAMATTFRVVAMQTGTTLAETTLPSEMQVVNDVAIEGRRSRVELAGWTKKLHVWFDDPNKPSPKAPDGPTIGDVADLFGKALQKGVEGKKPVPPKKN
jgi:outer membrane protein assembly factor BamB